MNSIPERIEAFKGVTVPEVMEYEDLAFYLGLGVSTIREKVGRYEIPFFEPTPGRVRFYKPAIDEWIKARMVVSQGTHSETRDARRKFSGAAA